MPIILIKLRLVFSRFFDIRENHEKDYKRQKNPLKPFVMGPKYRESKTMYSEKVKLDVADLNESIETVARNKVITKVYSMNGNQV